jgi:hypothetical protein
MMRRVDSDIELYDMMPHVDTLTISGKRIYVQKVQISELELMQFIVYEGRIHMICKLYRGNSIGTWAVALIDINSGIQTDNISGTPLLLQVPRVHKIVVDNPYEYPVDNAVVNDAIEEGYRVELTIEDYGHRKVIRDYAILGLM